MIDLIHLHGIEPPAGDLGVRPSLAQCRALWTTPIEGEEGAPPSRIIHVMALRFPFPATLHRLGLRRALGYHKCGSHEEHDWITSFRVRVWDGHGWLVTRTERNIPPPRGDEILWFDLADIATTSAMIEVRSCGIDGWWTPWNLCSRGLLLEGVPPEKLQIRGEKALTASVGAMTSSTDGVSCSVRNGEVRYRSAFLEIGFCLRRAGLSYLAIDDEGLGRTEQNLLKMIPGTSFQGLYLHPVGSGPAMASSIRYDVEGTTHVENNTVTYLVKCPSQGQEYELAWHVARDRVQLHARRTGDAELRAWGSSAWSIGWDPRASATAALGNITRVGETGNMYFPILLHAPGHGSLEVTSDAEDALWRTDVYRAADLALHQLKLGERAQPEGDYLLLPGTHRATLSLHVCQSGLRLRGDAPAEVVRAISRCAITGLAYRADTGTFSNNGISIHCPLSMDTWSALAMRVREIMPGLDASDLLRDSMERWLDGGPGYGSGGFGAVGEFHLAEDEYLMTGAAALRGIADFLVRPDADAWLSRYGPRLGAQLALMRERDLDNDGLIESKYRLGISGQYHWSTCFYDVISFGWKCAFSNALLYAALVRLDETLTGLRRNDLASGLREWAELLKKNYLSTFYNPATGWLAGWRCKEGKLHDHAFITVNGVAVASGVVDVREGKEIMGKIWAEALRVGLPDVGWGLPASLWPIPDDDLAEIQHGFAFGYYGNGGLTTAQTRHVAEAFFRVGMEKEGELLVRRMCTTLGEASVFGGAKSGIDGRAWDGWPCGYEGILTEQFGILAVAIDHYAQPPAPAFL